MSVELLIVSGDEAAADPSVRCARRAGKEGDRHRHVRRALPRLVRSRPPGTSHRTRRDDRQPGRAPAAPAPRADRACPDELRADRQVALAGALATPPSSSRRSRRFCYGGITFGELASSRRSPNGLGPFGERRLLADLAEGDARRSRSPRSPRRRGRRAARAPPRTARRAWRSTRARRGRARSPRGAGAAGALPG